MRLPLILILTAGAALSSVNADARQGDLFGYRLGTRYPMTTNTRTGMSGIFRYVEAENATKPETISEVTLLTTPKTLQIVAVSGRRSFRDTAEAWHFFNVLTPMLASHYNIRWRDNRTQNGVEVILSSRYRLSVYLRPQGTSGAAVFVLLTKVSLRDLAALARSELRQEVSRPQAQPFLRGF
jgi:hypothetical protein